MLQSSRCADGEALVFTAKISILYPFGASPNKGFRRNIHEIA